MKKMKFFGLFLLTLIILVAGLCWAVSTSIDDMIKGTIQQKMAALTKTEVTLSDLETDLLGGRIVIKDLVIANPKGYHGDYLVRLGDVQVLIDIRSLNSGAIIIESIQLNEVDVVIEEKSIGQINIKALIDTVESADLQPEPIDLLRFRLMSYAVAESTLHLIGGPLTDKTLSLPGVERQSNLGSPIALPLKGVVKGLIQEVMKEILKEGQGAMKDSFTQSFTKGFTQKIGTLGSPPVNLKVKIQKIKKVIEKELPPLNLPPLPFLP
ncbi:hypothetical protein A9Q81_13735 [Gammaproteobacteria bacterium 42_54_T18]|nr:hypothetical protein A9Q81_13735 [Gammaproteobacteria bacterium 42_54_T18]